MLYPQLFGFNGRYRLMKIIVAIAFYFSVLGRMFSRNRHGQGKISSDCVLIPKKFKTVCEATISLERLFRRENPPLPFGSAIFLLFTVVFSALGLALRGVLNLDGYLSAFWYFLAFSEGLGLFDLLVIDLLWWRNTKRTRFSFLPEKKYYQNPKKHIESFWRGIPLFAAVAALSALIVTAL